MQGWAALYEQATALTPEWGHHRIFAPVAYRMVRERPVVPISHTEAFGLARAFPICWQTSPGGATLVVLRSLVADAAAVPAGVRQVVSLLPHALQAFPIVVPADAQAIAARIRVDRVVADAPTDVGAPLMMGDGRLSRAAAARARLALKLGRSLEATRDLSERLESAGLLEPWPLDFDLGDNRRATMDGLAVLSRERLDDPVLYAIVARHGIDAGLFLAAHRLSLFRTASLVAAARQAAAASRLAATGRAA
jgi:hypothetical protein